MLKNRYADDILSGADEVDAAKILRDQVIYYNLVDFLSGNGLQMHQNY